MPILSSKEGKMLILGIVAVLALAVMLWVLIARPYQSRKAVLTNLQITEMDNSSALAKVACGE